MAVPAPRWTLVRKFLINNSSNPPDLFFARRFCILVVISAFITSQGDFTTTQRIVDGLSSLVGIDQKSRWKYLSIMVWRASEFGIGWWLDCTGAEVASLALLCYAPITYVLASASTFTSVSSLLVNILATSGPYYFLQQKPLTIQPPRRQNLDWNGWWLRWIYSATAAVLYSLVIHKAAKWVLPQIRKYFPLARHALRESDLNWKWLLCSIPFLSIAVWNLFRVPNLPQHRITENTKGKGSEKGRIYWLEDLRIIKRISVVFFLSSVLTWVQLKAKSEVL